MNYQTDYDSVSEVIARTIRSRVKPSRGEEREELLQNAVAHSWTIFVRCRQAGHDIPSASRIAAATAAKRCRDPFAAGKQGVASVKSKLMGDYQPSARPSSRLDETLECLPRRLREFANLLATGRGIEEAAAYLGYNEGTAHRWAQQLRECAILADMDRMRRRPSSR